MNKNRLPVYTIPALGASRAGATDFVADRFDHYYAEHRHLAFPHKHDFYQLVFFTGGSGSHSIDFMQFPVRGGQVYVMVPGQVHGWHFRDIPKGYIVNFSEAYLQALVDAPRYLEKFSFFSGAAEEQVLDVPVRQREPLKLLFETMLREAAADAPLGDDYIRCLLVQVFILLSRSGGKQQVAAGTPYNLVLFRNFKKLIEQHYKEKKLTRDYAALLYVTPNHLNALSKDVSGKTAGELIRDRVLLEAKRLLVNAGMPISQIAAELDFADNSYFSRFFKKYTGVSPETFRNQVHNH